MRQDIDKYQFPQLEIYKESLELAHLKKKTIIFNLFVFVLAGLLLYFLLQMNIDVDIIISTMIMFVVLLTINLAFYSYDNDHYNNLKIAMYISIMGLYIISDSLILRFPTPSIFTILFLTYAITSIYQDYKAMILSNSSLFISGILLILRFPTIFEIVGSNESQTFFILVFLIIFVTLLSLSSYILIKRKTFFYNQLAQIKESEVRNMELLLEIEKIKTNRTLNTKEYYESFIEFSKHLSKKIGIENVFERKIELLKDLKEMDISEILAKYPEYTLDEINEIKYMELDVHKKMAMIGIKASKSYGIEVSRKEIFSESQFKSFKHFGDNRYVKIISFVLFYTLLKLDKPYLEKLEEEKVKDILLNSEYFYRIDREIINIYLENNDVFDTIVKDHMKEVK